MQNLKQARELDRVAKRYASPPSDRLRLSDPYAAHCFDEAIALVGLWYEVIAQKLAQEQADKEKSSTSHQSPGATVRRETKEFSIPVLSRSKIAQLLAQASTDYGSDHEISRRLRARLSQIDKRPSGRR